MLYNPAAMTNASEKTVLVVGLGYVGFPLSLLISKKGYKTIGLDKDIAKIEKINKQESPFKDPSLEANMKKYHFEATNDFAKVKYADIVVVCVPTPVNKDKSPDLSIVEAAITSVAHYMMPGQLIILESTVNPGVSDEVVIPLLEKISGMKCGEDFYYAFCPERINLGVENNTDEALGVESVARVVGGYNEKSTKLAYEFYNSIISAEVKTLYSPKEAEAVKILENCFRDVNIAFINEMAKSFDKIGIDIKNVIDGAATKPYGFKAFYPGPGVGGHCIPVDPYYQIEYAKKFGFDHKLLNLAREINTSMPHYTVELVNNLSADISKNKDSVKISLLGLAYKPGVDDLRESPSLEILELLEIQGYSNIVTFDPYLEVKSTASSIADAIQDADVVIVATNHSQFSTLSGELLAAHNAKSIVDCRNSLDINDYKTHNIRYVGIGRADSYFSKNN